MTGPRRSAYRQLLKDHEQRPFELPVDLAVDNDSEVTRLHREMLRLQRRLRVRGSQERALLAYANLRSRLAAVREQLYFDQGFLRGRLAGLAERRLCRREGRDLARRLTEVVLNSGVKPAAAGLAMLETAYALFGAARASQSKG